MIFSDQTRLDRLERERVIQIRPMHALYAVHPESSSDGGRTMP